MAAVRDCKKTIPAHVLIMQAIRKSLLVRLLATACLFSGCSTHTSTEHSPMPAAALQQPSTRTVSTAPTNAAPSVVRPEAQRLQTKPQQRTTPPRRSTATGAYPFAKSTKQHGIVISPHAPYKKVNVRNYPSGSVAEDPTTKKRFRVP